MAVPKFSTLELELQDGVLLIRFNREKRLNSFNIPQYTELIQAFEWAKNSDVVRVVIITGKGNYYSSGNDLAGFMQVDLSDTAAKKKALDEAVVILTNFVNAFIHFPKILIAAVNGPAIGVAATTLALCDFVYGSEKCTLNTPFVPLAQSPEACSSFTFPLRMGPLRANEVLMLNRKLNAKEAQQFNMLNDVFPHDQLLPKVMQIAKQLADSPPESLMESKKLVKPPELLKKLDEVSKHEVRVLNERWNSSEFMEAIVNFMMSKGSGRSKM